MVLFGYGKKLRMDLLSISHPDSPSNCLLLHMFVSTAGPEWSSYSWYTRLYHQNVHAMRAGDLSCSELSPQCLTAWNVERNFKNTCWVSQKYNIGEINKKMNEWLKELLVSWFFVILESSWWWLCWKVMKWVLSKSVLPMNTPGFPFSTFHGGSWKTLFLCAVPSGCSPLTFPLFLLPWHPLLPMHQDPGSSHICVAPHTSQVQCQISPSQHALFHWSLLTSFIRYSSNWREDRHFKYPSSAARKLEHKGEVLASESHVYHEEVLGHWQYTCQELSATPNFPKLYLHNKLNGR